jgi:hypothetical protein
LEALLFDWLIRFLRQRKRQNVLAQASNWPMTTAKLLGSTVVPKDLAADGGTAFQDRQIESAFYFTLNGTYYGGHLRSTPVSDSEGHRLIRQLPEDTPVQVRYNPANPDDCHTFATDNDGSLPITIWPS